MKWETVCVHKTVFFFILQKMMISVAFMLPFIRNWNGIDGANKNTQNSAPGSLRIKSKAYGKFKARS